MQGGGCQGEPGKEPWGGGNQGGGACEGAHREGAHQEEGESAPERGRVHDREGEGRKRPEREGGCREEGNWAARVQGRVQGGSEPERKE